MSLHARIELETWDGPRTSRERLPEASPQGLREALCRLDGHRTDSCWIDIEDVGSLCVGGGPSRFVVVSFPSDGTSSHVVVGDDDGTTVELQVGGQTGVYPSVMVLPAVLAFDIAEHFLLFRAFDPALRWVKDCPPSSY
ncbi:MAG: hypothetical protein JWM16_4538 [Verrucomicrobiales bacterium]|nr:hypothetical protein [Verrucomicrobiales bacterium]